MRRTARIVTWCALSTGITAGAFAGPAPYRLEIRLPPLPRGVREAGDVHLTPAPWLAELRIPGFRRIDHDDGSVDFSKPFEGMGEATKLTERQARAMADAFVDKHVPQLAGRKRFEGVSHTQRVSGIGGGQEKTEIVGHTVYYGFDYKGIPLISDQIVVSIRDDKVKNISITAHAVEELGGAKRLLTARTVLDRFAIPALVREGHSPPVVDRAGFGYSGGFKQEWEEPKKVLREFRALPGYCFEFRWPEPFMGGFGLEYAFDARTGELLYPKPAEGPGQVSVPGPTLTFARPSAQMAFLMAPRDIQVRSATLDLETSPVEHPTRTFSVREMFRETGRAEFVSDSHYRAEKIGALREEAFGEEVTGTFTVDAPGRYRIEMLVKQRTLGEPTGTVVAVINDEPKVLGRTGPHTRLLWETWGTLDLAAGRHAIRLASVPGSTGGWAVGPLRLCALEGTLESRVRDLQITFGQADDVHVAVAAPGDRLTTADVRDRLHCALAYQTPEEVPGRNVTPVTISSAAPGMVRLRALNVSFVTGDAGAAGSKARQFLLVGPGGETVRPPTLDEVGAFAAYVNSHVAEGKGPGPDLIKSHEEQRVYAVLSAVAERCPGRAGAKHLDAARGKWNALAAQEPLELVRWLVFAGDSADRDKAPDRPKDMARNWAAWLSEIYTSILDPERLTPEGGYLDPWGRPYRVVYPPGHSSALFELYSFGPDGRDDQGGGDDVASWQPTAAERERLRAIAGDEDIDPRRVRVLLTRSGGEGQGTAICSMNLAERKMVELGRGERPVSSPDGRRILFCAGNPRNRDIFVMDADGRNVKRLTDDPADDCDPSWSPDGRRIAFVSDRARLHQVAVMNADGSGQELVTRERKRFSDTRWRSKDVILCSGEYGRHEVCAVRPGGGGPRFCVLTEGTQPDLAADGRTLAATHHGRNVRVKAEGMAEPVDVTRFRGRSTHPVWVGRSWIVFASDRRGDFGELSRAGQYDLYRMRPDGSEVERLTETPQDEFPSDVSIAPEGGER